MKYSALISVIDREVRDPEAWPPVSDPSRVDDQLNIIYSALLAVMSGLPIARLPQEDETLVAADYIGTAKQFNLPANLFTDREDLGISSITTSKTAGVGAVHVKKQLAEAVSISSLNSAATNQFQASNMLMSIDPGQKRLFVNAASECKIVYSPKPTEPIAANYEAEDVPITGKDLQRVVHLVATHVQGTRARDTAAAQFNQILNETYRGQ